MRCLSLVLFIVIGGAATTAQAQSSGGAVLLKNDRLMEGRVERRGEFYQVHLAADSQVSLPANQVAFIGRDKDDVYQHKLTSVDRWGVGDHFQMTRWCLANNLVPQAAEHYQQVARQAAGHPRVKQLAQEVKRKLLEQPDFRAYLGMQPLKNAPRRTASSANDEPKSDFPVATASATLHKTAMHPEIASRFSQRVQPILMNRCSQSACHGVTSNNRLRLSEPYAQAFARVTSENLRQVLPHVAENSKEISPLLKYATTPHGIQQQAAISVTETQLLNELGSWIEFVQNPVVTALATARSGSESGQPVVPSVGQQRFVPYHPATTLVPVAPGSSGLRQVPRSNPGDVPSGFPAGQAPTLAEIDALERELATILGESPTTSPSVPSTPAGPPTSGATSSDPFDPEEFNRQSGSSR